MLPGRISRREPQAPFPKPEGDLRFPTLIWLLRSRRSLKNVDLWLSARSCRSTAQVAPRDGKLGEIGVRLGQYVSAGSQLASLVPDVKWVTANFKETQLSGMQIGQAVSFTVDALDHVQLSGHIEDFSPATGSEFSVLKSDNATGNFTKVSQRLPVRIAIDPGQPDADRLAPGMSVVVKIDTSATPTTP